jgi:hypothetical protein
LGSALHLEWSLSSENGEINFNQGLGMPSNTGTITLTHSSAGQKVIGVNNIGMVEEK